MGAFGGAAAAVCLCVPLCRYACGVCNKAKWWLPRNGPTAHYTNPQADDMRRRWQEAERRVTELQVSGSRAAEELASRLRSVEAAAAAAREEAARGEAAADRLRQELAAAQDAVKVGRGGRWRR